MNQTRKIEILAYASDPSRDIDYYGDIIVYDGKKYFVSLNEERVEYICDVKVSL